MNPRPLIFSFDAKNTDAGCNKLQTYVRSRKLEEQSFVFTPDISTLHYFIVAQINEKIGLGVFARCDIPAGTTINHGGKIIFEASSQKELDTWFEKNPLRNPKYDCTDYMWAVHDKANKKHVIINGLHQSGIPRFINHGIKKNAIIQFKNGQLTYFFSREIKAGEQIVTDYGQEYFTHHAHSPIHVENSSEHAIWPILTDALQYFNLIPANENIQYLCHTEMEGLRSVPLHVIPLMIERALELLAPRLHNETSMFNASHQNVKQQQETMPLFISDAQRKNIPVIRLYADNKQNAVSVELNGKETYRCDQTSQYALVIAPSPNRANKYCLFTEVDIPKGKPVFKITGSQVTEQQITQDKLNDLYIFDIGNLHYYCEKFGSEARFALNANKKKANAKLSTKDSVVATRNIEAGEEICLHYSNEDCCKPYTLQQILQDYEATQQNNNNNVATSSTGVNQQPIMQQLSVESILTPETQTIYKVPSTESALNPELEAIIQQSNDIPLLAPDIFEEYSPTHAAPKGQPPSSQPNSTAIIFTALPPTFIPALSSSPVSDIATLLESNLNEGLSNTSYKKYGTAIYETFNKFLPLLENGFEQLQTLQINKSVSNYDYQLQKEKDTNVSKLINFVSDKLKTILTITDSLYLLMKDIASYAAPSVESPTKKQKTEIEPLANCAQFTEAKMIEEIEKVIFGLSMMMSGFQRLAKDTKQQENKWVKDIEDVLKNISNHLFDIKDQLGLNPSISENEEEIDIIDLDQGPTYITSLPSSNLSISKNRI